MRAHWPAVTDHRTAMLEVKLDAMHERLGYWREHAGECRELLARALVVGNLPDTLASDIRAALRESTQ